MPAEQLPDIARDVAQLTTLVTSVVTIELHERFGELASDYLESAEGPGLAGDPSDGD